MPSHQVRVRRNYEDPKRPTFGIAFGTDGMAHMYIWCPQCNRGKLWVNSDRCSECGWGRKNQVLLKESV